MTTLSRRTLLQGVGAGGSLALGLPAAAAPGLPPVARAGGGTGGPDRTMTWRQPPQDWRTAPFLGNGALVAHVLVDPQRPVLSFDLGPAGSLQLPLPGALTAVRFDLDLANAELTGSVGTTRGTLEFTAVVHRELGVLLVSVRSPGRPAVRADGGLKWREQRSGTHRLLVARPGDGTPPPRVSAAGGLDRLLGPHRKWWQGFWTRSSVSLPDESLQRFSWMQQYAAGSLPAPPGGAAATVLNTTGHAELNQLTAPQPAIAPPNHDHLVWGIPGVGARLGRGANPIAAWDLPPRCDAYRPSADDRILRESLRPLLRRAVGFYSAYLTEGSDGCLHLPVTHSPGYADVADSTYDLSLLRWATRRLLDVDALLGEEDPSAARWHEIAARLTPYHADDSGALIGAGVRLATSHRYASHLWWLYPLRERRWSRPGDRAEMRRGYQHWAAQRDAWPRESHATAAAMAAAVRDAGAALTHLAQFTGDGMYHLGPRDDPGAPFVAGGALLSLLADEAHDGGVEVFPALPGAWRDVSVAGLRLPGARTVDAARRDGRTAWVRVRSELGGRLLLRHGIDGEVTVRDTDGGPLRAVHSGRGTTTVELAAGGGVLVRGPGEDPESAA